MKYSIKIYYKTGNSFEMHDEEDFVEFEWKNLKMVEKSLLRIIAHYEFYKEHDNIWEKPKGRLPKGVLWDDEYNLILLELLDDNGIPFKTSPFWTGYFEILQHAEIVLSDEKMKYTP